MSKYIDNTAVIQVIAGIYDNPSLLDINDKYFFLESDFQEKFHRVIFGTINNLHVLGNDNINKATIFDYLKERPKDLAIYQKYNGDSYLDKLKETYQKGSFDYYYNRMKKFSLFRGFEDFGIDMKDLYDADNILNAKLKQEQEEWLDKTSVEEIALLIDDKVAEVRRIYVDNFTKDAVQCGQGIRNLITRYKESPEVGVPLYGSMVNSITRGARLKKFYLRSAPQGFGKTRMLIADLCFITCPEMYVDGEWISTGASVPGLFITTEQELEEIQTMMLCFLAGVDEEHILLGKYEPGEEERVLYAAQLIENAPVYLEELHDFSLSDVENTIKKNIRQHDCSYVFLDYIHTSMKILTEISHRSGIPLREDNVLYMMSVKLKDICNEYGVFIESGTQLNGDAQLAKTPDQNCLRGAKALADKIDLGEIMVGVTDYDLEVLAPILGENGFPVPDTKISIYKNRRGKHSQMFLWCNTNLGQCRVNPMFATDWNYKPMVIEDLEVIVE